MSKSRLLVTLTITALIAGCASSDRHHRNMGGKTAADINVHAIDATTDQEIVELQARAGVSGTTSVPSTVHWKTDDPGATLNIQFDPGQQCVVELMCAKNECSAKTNVDYHGSAPLRCHYRTVVGAVAHDPVIIIDNCCP